VDDVTPKERAALHDSTRKDMIVEFVLHRLKVPDGANRPPTEPVQPGDSPADSDTYSRAESKTGVDAKGTESSAAGGAPFLQRMSNDGDESVLCTRSVILDQPYKQVHSTCCSAQLSCIIATKHAPLLCARLLHGSTTAHADWSVCCIRAS
jgi:hypothetical protein